MEDEVQIKIPRADEKEVATFSSGEIGNIKKKFEKIDQILFGIMLTVVLSMVAIIVSVIGLFLDQMHFNSAAYKEYTQKTEAVEEGQKINNTLLKLIQDLSEQNKENQEIIIELQKQSSKK